jgi:hypothetical protein
MKWKTNWKIRLLQQYRELASGSATLKKGALESAGHDEDQRLTVVEDEESSSNPVA